MLTGTNTYTGGTAINGGTLRSQRRQSRRCGRRTELQRRHAQEHGGIRFARNVTLDAGRHVRDRRRPRSDGHDRWRRRAHQDGRRRPHAHRHEQLWGGTVINGGVVSVASNANLGDATGALTFDGGTLQDHAAFASARNVTLNAAGGTFETLADLDLSGLIAGAGALTKTGAGMLILTADNTYTGGTTIAAGTLQLGNGGTTGASSAMSSTTARWSSTAPTPTPSPA